VFCGGRVCRSNPRGGTEEGARTDCDENERRISTPTWRALGAGDALAMHEHHPIAPCIAPSTLLRQEHSSRFAVKKSEKNVNFSRKKQLFAIRW